MIGDAARAMLSQAKAPSLPHRTVASMGDEADKEVVFRESHARELRRTSSAVFGGWEERRDGLVGDRERGLLEEMESIKRAIRFAIAIAGAAGTVLGAALGSLITLYTQHLMAK